MPKDDVSLGDVSLKEHLLGLLKEIDLRYSQKATATDKAIDIANEAVKDALVTSKNLISEAAAMVEKATDKAEKSTNDRFHAVNEFRKTLAEQQNTFARGGEVGIRFESLEKKVDANFLSLNLQIAAILGQQQTSKGKDAGLWIAWTIAAVVAGLLLSGLGIGVGVVIAIMRSM